jgi:methionine-S-sulfoxide reductase
MVFANGCFWGSEKGAWRLPGVFTTACGYAAGFTPNPTYEEVCSGRTGHTEAVQVVFDPTKIAFTDILRWFWESHDPSQGMGQGNDRGTQYRSGLYWMDEEQEALILASKVGPKILCQRMLSAPVGFPPRVRACSATVGHADTPRANELTSNAARVGSGPARSARSI